MDDGRDQDLSASSAGVRFVPNAPELDDGFWEDFSSRTVTKSAEWRLPLVVVMTGLVAFLVGLANTPLAMSMGIVGAWVSNALLKRKVRRALKQSLLAQGISSDNALFLSNADGDARRAFSHLEECIEALKKVPKRRRVKSYMRISSMLKRVANSSASAFFLSLAPLYFAALAKNEPIIATLLWGLLGSLMFIGILSIPALVLGMVAYGLGAIPLGRDVSSVERFWGRCKAIFGGDYFAAERAFFRLLDAPQRQLSEGHEESIVAPSGAFFENLK